MLLERDATDNVPISRRDDRTWTVPAWLVVVFAAVQLGVGLKYLHTGLTELWLKTHHPRSRTSADGRRPETLAVGTSEFSGFPMPSLRRFLTRDYQRSFETAAQAHFLVPQAALVPLYRDCSAQLSRVALRSVLPLRMTVEPLHGEYSLVRVGTDERISGLPALYRPEDEAKLSERASYYHRLQAAWPKVHFYVFPTLLVADWYAVAGLYGAGAEKHLAGDRYLRKFRTLADPALGFGWVAEGRSFPEAIAYYFRTDQHWNAAGAYQAYRQIHQLLCAKNPQLGPPRVPERWIELPGLVYHGTFAHRGGCYEALGDTVGEAVCDLPELKIRIYGFEDRERNAQRRYRAGDYTPGRFTNHYAEYFGYDYGLIEYTSGPPPAASGPSGLLVISDSFDNCIESLLASHFAHSWFVDLRHYAEDVGGEFDIDAFLRQHPITDVLFVGTQYLTLGVGVDPFPP